MIRVLIVEDQRMAREDMENYIQSSGRYSLEASITHPAFTVSALFFYALRTAVSARPPDDSQGLRLGTGGRSVSAGGRSV